MFKNKRLLNNAKGYSLVEVLAAVFITTLALVAIMNTISLGTSASVMVEREVIAQKLLEAAMEEISARSFSISAGGTYTHASYPNYTILAFEITNYLGNNYLKRVDVYINWPAPLGGLRQETASFLFADY